jgi:hypothetical protein
VVLEFLTDRRLPQPGNDLELLLQPVEAFPGRGKGDPVGPVLAFEPARSDPELRPPAAHGIHLGDRHGQRAGEAESGRGDQGAEPDPAGLPGQPGEGDPRVGRTGQAGAVPHPQVVIGAEEGVEALLLGAASDSKEVFKGGALLWLGEHSEFHAFILPGLCRAIGPDRRPGARRLRPRRGRGGESDRREERRSRWALA